MNLDLSFEVVKEFVMAQYSAGCVTNGPSVCCTTYCTTRNCKSIDSDNNSIDDWNQYFELNTGVLQY